MPTCNKCHPTFDLGRICPHEGPGLEVWEQGRTAGRAEGATILLDLIAALVDAIDRAEARLRKVTGDE